MAVRAWTSTQTLYHQRDGLRLRLTILDLKNIPSLNRNSTSNTRTEAIRILYISGANLTLPHNATIPKKSPENRKIEKDKCHLRIVQPSPLESVVATAK